MQVVSIFEPELRHGALYSQNRHDRYSMLATLNLGMSRPMLAAALALRNAPAAGDRLREAFPYQRKLLERLARLADSMPNKKIEGDNRRTVRFSGQATIKPIKAVPEYLAAARQAINQLGEIADRGELLQCAESILKSTCQQPVDI